MADTLGYISAHDFDFSQAEATPDKVGSHFCAVFADSGDDFIHMDGFMPQAYDGASVQFKIFFASPTTASGNVKWDLQVERLANNGTAITADSFDVVTSTTKGVGTPTVASLAYGIITVTSGNMDGVVAGEYFRLKLIRDTTDAADTLTGDAVVLGVAFEGGFA